MYLSQLKLWNYRKFGKPDQDVDTKSPHLVLDFNKGINLLVGENDSGKSSIVDAIKLVLRTHSLEWIRIEDDDFCERSKRFRIECFFRGLKDDEAKHFVEWLGMEDEGGKAVPYLRLVLDVKRTDDRVLPFEVRGGPDAEGRALSPEAREYLKCTYLKPLRDAKTELIARKNSRLSQILYSHPVFKEKEDHKLVKVLAGANEEIKKYFENEAEKGTNGYVVLQTLKKYLTGFLRKDSPQDTKLHIDDPKLKNILEILKLTLQDERSGLGTYNLLFIAAELLHLRREKYEGLKLGLIEETEAHLHPQAQLRVVSALENEADEGEVQLILTTHSPNLASRMKVKDLILCHGNSTYPLGDAYTELKPTDYFFLERFLDVTKANLFFAQGVILVEGDAENILVPTVAKLIGRDLTSHGVSVVNVGGTTFLRYCGIFKRKDGKGSLKLPVAVITDLDVKPEKDAPAKTTAAQNKVKKYSGQCVKTFVSPHWTLEYCIALSPNLRQMEFEAIKSAGKEMKDDGYSGKEVTDDWVAFSSGFDDVTLAKKIYELLTDDGKKISKAIAAQYLAKSLEERLEDQTFVDKIKKDANIDYIIQAINHVTTNSNN